MNYQDEYKKKKRTLFDAYEILCNRDVIACGCCGNEPVAFLKNLSSQKDTLSQLSLLLSLSLGEYDFLDDATLLDFITVYSWFLMGPTRRAYNAGFLEYVPGHLHNCSDRQNQVNRATVFVTSVTPMDRHGYFRYSLCNIAENMWLKNADRVILEVNPNMPITYGDNEVHISQVDCVYEVDIPIPILKQGELGDSDKAIGEYVASLVDDGDTIQLGIGSIPDAVAQAFMSKRDLGVHTEMITNSIVDLVEAGVINGRKKSLHDRKIVGVFALGSQRLYDFLHHNPSVLIMPGSYVNDPYVVSRNDNMVSINTSLGVDFCGQVSSEAIGSVQYSGTGGQNDTAEGSIHARNGRSIIAMKSTVKNGTISAIQSTLNPGSIVTLSRNNVDYIVTEYGIANLKSKSIQERTKALISIAHPKFRDQLTEEAIKLRFLRRPVFNGVQ